MYCVGDARSAHDAERVRNEGRVGHPDPLSRSYVHGDLVLSRSSTDPDPVRVFLPLWDNPKHLTKMGDTMTTNRLLTVGLSQDDRAEVAGRSRGGFSGILR